MQVKIGSTDVTQYVQEKTYDINAEKKYTSTWTDSNHVEHRDGAYEKITGTFQMVFIDGYTANNTIVDGFSDFLTLLSNNTSGGVTAMSVTVNNQNGVLKTISAYVDLKASPMRYPNNGSHAVVKRVTVTVKEQ